LGRGQRLIIKAPIYLATPGFDRSKMRRFAKTCPKDIIVLFQFKANFDSPAAVIALAQFCKAHFAARLAFEFRNKALFFQAVYSEFAKLNLPIVSLPKSFITDKYGLPTKVPQTGRQIAYFRFHGPESSYKGTYRYSRLKTWARNNPKFADDVYILFNNTEYAYEDATYLKKILGAG